MNINALFSVLASVASIYILLCCVRVMLSWFPGAEYSKFGQVLAQMCDPYLNLFRRLRFLRFSSFDFTLCVLMAAQAFFTSLAMGTGFRLSTILAMLVMLVGNIITSILGFLVVILVVRLIVYLIIGDGNVSYSIWTVVDRSLSPLMFRIAGAFFRWQYISFVKALVTSIITLIVTSVAVSYVIRILGTLISMIPF